MFSLELGEEGEGDEVAQKNRQPPPDRLNRGKGGGEEGGREEREGEKGGRREGGREGRTFQYT